MNWPGLTDEHITKVLKSLSSSDAVEGEAVYICGGKLYQLDDGKLVCREHEAAKPYLWPIAHEVRPAAQSLGVRDCQDCHALDASFFFGDVRVDSPIVSQQDLGKKMVDFQDVSPLYTKAFAVSFIFRPWLKIIALGSCAVIAAVLILYALKALGFILKVVAEEDKQT